ncbi:MAG: alpha-E domain-containing protein [Elusimicrobia bacterium]|nr:alpha-E domain-containing protein [Elusimicrobiota bacterium]
MLSRVAESVYWTARYAERAENTARLVEAWASLSADLPASAFPGWERLLDVTSSRRAYAARVGRVSEAGVSRFLLIDAGNPNSVLSCLEKAREDLRTVRDVVPDAVWEQFNTLTLRQRQAAERLVSASQRYVYTARTRMGCLQHVGILMGTMSRDAAYQFILVGRAVERADMSARFLELRPGPDAPYAPACWRAVLKALTGYHMYRRACGPQIDGTRVARFLLQDAFFPRAVGRCLASAEPPLKRLPRPEAALEELRRTLKAVRRVPARSLQGQPLLDVLEDVQARVARLHGVLARTYFLPGGPR